MRELGYILLSWWKAWPGLGFAQLPTLALRNLAYRMLDRTSEPVTPGNVAERLGRLAQDRRRDA